jgi:hypothetical protein
MDSSERVESGNKRSSTAGAFSSDATITVLRVVDLFAVHTGIVQL